MENLSHSRHPNRFVPSLPKKPCNGSGGYGLGSGKAAATTYDDVFGGPPRFGAPSLSPRLEDYCEIFGGFNGSARVAVSSIPVLDLPLADDGDVYFDVRSRGFDYREVFGGFEDFDLAPLYEDLLMERSEGGDGDSSDEAWTPAETESVSGGTEHSGKSPCFSNGRDSYESFDGSTELAISYNKAAQRSSTNMSNGTAHLAEPGLHHSYNFTVDEMVYAGRTTKEKQAKKTQSLARSNTSSYAFGNDDGASKHYSRTGSFPSETFMTISDISLKTQPSELPPPSRPPPTMRRDSNSSASNYKTTGSESSVGGNSPPFFDVEVDASSAAVKEAMEKAQAKLKSAKELLERKRDGARMGVKPGSATDRIVREGKSSHNEVKLPVLSPELAENTDVARKLSADERRKKSLPSHGSAKFDGNDEWKEATQFFELVRTEKPGNVGENSGVNDVSLPQNSEFREQEQKEKRTAKVDLDKQQGRKAKGDWRNPEVEKLPKDLGSTKLGYRHKRHEKERLAKHVLQEGMEEKSRNHVLHFEAETNLPDHGLTSEQERYLPFVDKSAKQEKELRCKENNKGIENQEWVKKTRPSKAIQKKQDDLFDWEENARKLREALGVADNESTLEVSLEPKEGGKVMKMAGGTDEDEKKLKEALERIENENRMKETREKEENDRGLREALEKAENERRWKEALKQEEKERRLKEACEKEGNERRTREALEKAENEKRMKEQEEMERQIKEACEKEEKKRRMKESQEKAEHETKLKIALEQEVEMRIKEVRGKEENEHRIKQDREKAELERRLKEALEQEEEERKLKEVHEALERAENERRLKEALEQEERDRQEKEAREKEENERELKEVIEPEERERRLTEAHERAESERRLEEAPEQERMMGIQREAQERGGSENHEHQVHEEKIAEFMGQGNEERLQEALEREEIHEKLGEVGEREETDKISDLSECSEESLKEAPEEDEYDWEDNRKPLDDVQNEEDEPDQAETRNMSDSTSPWKDFEKKLKAVCIEEGVEGLDTGSGLFERNGEFKELGTDGEDYERNRESDEVSKLGTENIQEDVLFGKLEKKGGRFENSRETSALEEDVEMATNVKDDKKGWEGAVADEKVQKTAEDGVGCVHRNRGESKCTSKRSSDLGNHENKFTHHQEETGTQASLTQDAKLGKPLPPRFVKDSVDTARKAVAPNSTSQTAGNKNRNLDEISKQREKEAERIKRERELEMEQLRKIEEEREREREREKDRMAFDQRALADARERLEKACAEVREKTLADKLSAEARLRAERAAVERATAEARERAAEKAALEARERVERSVPSKQFQSSASFGASRYQNSSANADGESPQRYISKLERHRRTAERVAKALAEKNMRDLVVQREQAERNRLAEALDAEVKRWSGGKEGNIRALLSTLQYILGPESGWQPIPLTEVITSAAVRKAYRKATLCVHPDKLQQRGASVQQKYICEKVFDLLKEAWNRFNSEER